MKNNFEKELHQVMNEKKEIPIKVRKSLDQTYDMIRSKSKKKSVSFVWKGAATVACALILTGVILTNEHVMAGINHFFNFGDQGIEEAINKGFTQEDNSSVTDQDITITLDKHFSDANKIGMSLQLGFDNPALLNHVEEISMDYRLKNGNGEYIAESIPDTKPLNGENIYVSSLERHTSILDAKTGEVQFDVLMESHTGQIPKLEDAVIEVESVNIFYSPDYKMKKIDGNWELTISNQDMENITTEYVTQDQTSVIQVSKATASPTSLNITFSLNGIYDNENTFAHQMKIRDGDGHDYEVQGFEMSKQNGKTTISTNFPMTSYKNFNKLKLIVEGIGEVELLKK